MKWDSHEYDRILARVRLHNAALRRRGPLARLWDRLLDWFWSFAR
jgi:hypothetical protein